MRNIIEKLQSYIWLQNLAGIFGFLCKVRRRGERAFVLLWFFDKRGNGMMKDWCLCWMATVWC